MRTGLGAGLLALGILLPGSAKADEPRMIEVTHVAPVPCAAVCPQWDIPTALGFDVCEHMFPPGSHDESVYRFTSEVGVIRIRTAPVIDHDTFVCSDTEPRRLVTTLAHLLSERCDGGPIPQAEVLAWGCAENGELTLRALHEVNAGVNDRFVVVSYNWSDLYPLPIELHGPVELVDDSYEAPLG